MPTVTKSRSTRISEKTFEKAVAAQLKQAGKFSRHMSDRLSGLPDRYITGGIWVEFKSFEFRDSFRADQGISPLQRRMMEQLANGGDNVFYCALAQHNDERTIFAHRLVAGQSFPDFKISDWNKDVPETETMFAAIYPGHIQRLINWITRKPT